MTQTFISIYLPSKKWESKSLSIAFNEDELNIFNNLKCLTSEELREILRISFYEDIEILAKKAKRSIGQYIKICFEDYISTVNQKDVSFISSKNVPFQRWYPYLEGYWVDFIKYIVQKYWKDEYNLIYEPFAGTWTTIFGCSDLWLNSIYSEVNPLLYFIIDKKKKTLQLNKKERWLLSSQIEKIIKNFQKNNFLDRFNPDNVIGESYINCFKGSEYFSSKNYNLILKTRSYNNLLIAENKLLWEIFSIAVIWCLIPVSLLKRSWDVRFKTSKELEKSNIDFYKAITEKLEVIKEDLLNEEYTLSWAHEYIIPNAKNIWVVNLKNKIDMVITSPPYLNGTNYIRNTKLELWYLWYLKSQGDLRLFRNDILTSGINDVICKSDNSKDVLKMSPTLRETYNNLVDNAYDKRIPLMCSQYFSENYKLYEDLKSKLNKWSRIAIDIWDSIFSGIHIKVDKIYIEIMENLWYKLINHELLRKRRSRNGQILSQILLIFEMTNEQNMKNRALTLKYWEKWQEFKENIPYQKWDFKKRNWWHANHSICSYQWKLKPAIAYHLIKTFVPKWWTILDPFSWVWTIPFEAWLNNIKSYWFDLSMLAYYVSWWKLHNPSKSKVNKVLKKLKKYIENTNIQKKEIENYKQFWYNKKLSDYYEKNTFSEILLARKFFKENPPINWEDKLVISCLLHILHGNRPYALSRRSHPIVPYAPTWDFEYKSLMQKLEQKVDKTLWNKLPNDFIEGTIYNMDSTEIWPREVRDLDAIITSPPFFDSTRFYSANWIRLWFTGWEDNDFKSMPKRFVDERQKINFDVYDNIFIQARDRLKPGGVMILHLWKSKKCDMGKELMQHAKKWFKNSDIFTENVEHCESHWIRDKWTVTAHQFLLLY